MRGRMSTRMSLYAAALTPNLLDCRARSNLVLHDETDRCGGEGEGEENSCTTVFETSQVADSIAASARTQSEYDVTACRADATKGATSGE